jgi:hypothetical protein
MHPDRHVPERDLRRLESRRVHRERPVSRRWHVQHEHRSMLEPHGRERNNVQRRQRMHPDRQLPERDLRGRESRYVHRERSVSRRRNVRPRYWSMLEPERQQRDYVQRWRRLHADRRVPERHMYRVQSHCLHRK